MKKGLTGIIFFVMALAVMLSTDITVNEKTKISTLSVKSSSFNTAKIDCAAQEKVKKDQYISQAKTVKVPVKEAAKMAPAAVLNTKTKTERLPYDLATNEELWGKWCSVCKSALKGEKITSQTAEYKDFFRSATVRLANSKIIDLGIDYDYINDIVFDDDEGGIAKIGFDYDALQGIYYSAMNPWERNMGFCMEYDTIANYVADKLDTKRFKFNYNGYEWMIQVWKGQYGGVSIGAEIGTYYRDPKAIYPTSSFYKCVPDDKMLDVQMDFYYKDELLFSRPMQKNWWLTGFVFLQTCEPEETRVDAKIVFPNTEMRDAFTAALEGYGYVAGNSYTVVKNCVAFSY